MKHKINRFYSYVLLAIVVFLSYNFLAGNITVGLGLGDIIFIPIILIIFFSYLITLIINRKKAKNIIIINIIFTLPIMWLILSVTIWRGVQYPWNGELFFPSKESKRLYAEKEKNWISERDSLIHLIELDPNEINAYAKIGRLSSLLGEETEALNYYKIGAKKGDNFSKYLLAKEYEARDMKDKAIFLYREILDTDSTHQVAKIELRRLLN
ncbi:hypothetical protein [Persicobacter diffluens]|uniref:Tetratricopeptide repeat protein n=1 Tax=Persicobacter diffluens TaxID=981 RepID=A0AAN5AM62_9BACT|nr:hypothetical protein PEDI_52870 [Persicobacter diffluens]